MRAALPEDHRAVGQNIEARPPERLFSVNQTLAMQHLVHRVSAKAGAIGKGGQERLRRLVPAFETWAVAGGERGRLVEKEELGIAAAPDLAPSPTEFAHADDPAPVRPAPRAQRPVIAMEPSATIAHHRPPRGDGMKRAERIDAILKRASGLRVDGCRIALRLHLADPLEHGSDFAERRPRWRS